MRYGNRAGMETATATAGTITLGAAVSKHQTFANAGIQNGDTVPYFIEDGNAWEIGTGVYSSSGPTLTRVLLESSTGSLLTLSGAAQVYIDAQASFFNAGSGREVLTANRTYYVRTDGSDSNDGLSNTSGGAFLTIQKAIDTAAMLDLSIYNVTIQVGAGTYTSGLTVNGAWIGAGTVMLTGDATTPANCIISTTSASCITASSGGRISVSGFEFRTTTSGSALDASTGGFITVSGNVNFGACASNHMRAIQYGSILVSGVNYTINGSAVRHFSSSPVGYINLFSLTVTLTGTPAFSGGFAFADRLGFITNTGVTYSGSATGTRYTAGSNAVINTGGGGANFFPGNVAGATATGGQYL